jgi:hypothetical protein
MTITPTPPRQASHAGRITVIAGTWRRTPRAR